MQTNSSPRVEQDYRIFFVFMTFVMVGMYVWSLIVQPTLRTSWLVIPFTLLLAIHIIAHWNVNRIIQNRNRILWYILGQSALAFAIVNLSGNIGMIFALYMALIGETVGILGINRWGILSVIFYLTLSLANFVLFGAQEGAFFWLLTSVPTVVFVSMYVTLYTRQAEARERAQALASELETANQQLTEYAARVEDLTIAAERQRMARELHDTLSQGLAGLILQLEAADAHLTNNRTEKAQTIVGNAMKQARSTLADARRAIDDLRQPSSNDLDSALRLEISRFTDATGIPCDYHSDHSQLTSSLGGIPDPVKETVLRAVAEALTNVANHAQASKVAVDVRMKDKSLSVTIQDDGVGFDASNIPSGHYGLLGIRERVRLVNGSFEIQSDNGTILKIEIPIRAERSASAVASSPKGEAPL